MKPKTETSGTSAAARLGRSDQAAVDLILDGHRVDGASDDIRPAATAGGSMTMSGLSGLYSNPGDAAERIEAAERLLKLLDHLPAADPPESLLWRTMRRVEEARQGGGDSVSRPEAATFGQPGAISARHSPHTPDAADQA